MEADRRMYLSALKLLLLMGRLLYAGSSRVSLPSDCPSKSLEDFMMDSNNYTFCHEGSRFPNSTNVIEGDDTVLQKTLLRVHKNQDYTALLFYASWCPFSGNFRPAFSVLSTIFPSIPHLAIEEAAARPSILAKYGVHGFPALLLVKSTGHMRYRGSRTLDSLISFYADVTGIKMVPHNGVSLNEIGFSEYQGKQDLFQEICPFPWAKSPENLLQQETYLALATIFVILRLLYFASQMLTGCHLTWKKYIANNRLKNLWVIPSHYFDGVVQLVNRLKKPCKKSNLQEGAKNAKVWASKSLATVSFRDANSSHNVPLCM
ncbi:5'-adenylylsulfate reductase-like 4 [Dorcoceras hygrometricum]|uniref:5'-adenylylsulfate reductase-like 4 n=1 Tax=Dorcoceras hygrometricum TaxID=472368 RepID=A0A2Z7AQJ3_9LAMI|nr:5'-adenylylsulfate reductase-like 4 [Dorcoceras hygrometricum]